MVDGIRADMCVSFFREVTQKVTDLAKRIWKAVVGFFQWIAGEPQKVNKPIIPPNESVNDKLLAYQQMPIYQTPFLKKSIEILQTVLVRKDAKVTAKLIEDLGEDWAQLNIPKENLPEHWASFNTQFEDMEAECFPKIMMAAVRAYLFSGSVTPFEYFNTSAHEIRALSPRFRTLSNNDKEVVLDEFDPQNLDQLPISEDAKYILKEIGRISNQLIQGNPSFQRAAQAIMTGNT